MKVRVIKASVAGGFLAVSIALTGAVTGCAPVAAVGVGVAAGAFGAQQLTPEVAAADARIDDRIRQSWLATDGDMAARLTTTVYQGRVLVTGRVSNPEQRVNAVRAIWGVPGVVEVINEVQIAEEAGLSQAARDGWIGAQLRSRITIDSAVRAINYSIDVVDGVVYLMGVARSDAERDRVVNNARQIPYVSRVVDYIEVRDVAGGSV